MKETVQKTGRGFTIIELIVVIGAVALSLPVLFGLFFANLRSRSRVLALQNVKTNGDYVLNTMQTLIRQQARDLYMDENLETEICVQAGGVGANPYFVDVTGAWFRFYLTTDGRIASQSSTLGMPSGQVNLTENTVGVSQFSITCKKNALFGSPIVAVSFTLDHLVNSSIPERHEDQAKLSYSTKIKLRN